MTQKRTIFVAMLVVAVSVVSSLAVVAGDQHFILLPIVFLWAGAIVAPAALFWRINRSLANHLPQQPVLSPLFERPPPSYQV
jgi:hypothetical protein